VTPTLIRLAQPGDKAAILAFCQYTWEHEADYIPAVWDLWFADPSGHILVADLDGQAVGMTRLVQLSVTEGWWEGLRVDRAYRRAGIGSQLARAALEMSHSLDLPTLRTCVSVTNTSMHPLVQRQGFTPLGDYAVYRAPASENIPMALRQLGVDDCDRTWAAINHFETEECDPLFVVRGAKWQTLDRAALVQRLEQGWVWGLFEGDALVGLFIRSSMENPDGTLWIGWLGGTSNGLLLLLSDLHRLAHQLGFQAIGGFLPQGESRSRSLAANGYKFSDTSVYRLYAKNLAET